MIVRCVNRGFQDKAEGVWRNVGDEWEADASRLAEINRAGYGVMAEEVVAGPEETPAEQPEAASKARKAATPKKGTANRSRARKSAQEG